jgi:hypothetical protein
MQFIAFTDLSSPLFTEVPVPNQVSEWSCVCALQVPICLFLRFLYWILGLFRQCGILGLFRQCGILGLFRQCGILGLFRQCGIFVLFFVFYQTNAVFVNLLDLRALAR